MKILAVIPARAGSKRLPNKNMLLLGGKPLIAWSIEGAGGISDICDILVSTDDPELASIAKKFGAIVPWLRPLELATDESHVVDTLLHALDWYENNQGKVDGLLLLQPTSPFRTKESIVKAISLFALHEGKASIVGVSKAPVNPDWCFKLAPNGELVPFFPGAAITTRSQDLPTAYFINGLIYLANPESLRKYHSLLGDRIHPVIVNDESESLDIDDAADFATAQKILEN